MIKTLKNLFGKEYAPLNNVVLFSDALISNYDNLTKQHSGIQIAPVLKSNAYGHGIVEIAVILETLRPVLFCVDSIYEAYLLLNAGIKTKILVMGYVNPENVKGKKLPFSYAVYDEQQARAIHKYQPQAGLHIKLDTGMHRLGMQVEDLPRFIETLSEDMQIEGLMSHFAESEKPKSTLTKLQINNFTQALRVLESYNITPQWKHIANSEGLLNHKELKLDTYSNLARTGRVLYGISHHPEFKPVLSFISHIAQIKTIRRGEKVGYNGTFTAKRGTILAIIPAGYFDGIDRRLSNKGTMIVDGVSCPIVGIVSMNMTVIDVSNVSYPHPGQRVIVYASELAEPNTIAKSAILCDTIPSQLLIQISPTTHREII